MPKKTYRPEKTIAKLRELPSDRTRLDAIRDGDLFPAASHL